MSGFYLFLILYMSCSSQTFPCIVGSVHQHCAFTAHIHSHKLQSGDREKYAVRKTQTILTFFNVILNNITSHTHTLTHYLPVHGKQAIANLHTVRSWCLLQHFNQHSHIHVLYTLLITRYLNLKFQSAYYMYS